MPIVNRSLFCVNATSDHELDAGLFAEEKRGGNKHRQTSYSFIILYNGVYFLINQFSIEFLLILILLPLMPPSFVLAPMMFLDKKK